MPRSSPASRASALSAGPESWPNSAMTDHASPTSEASRHTPEQLPSLEPRARAEPAAAGHAELRPRHGIVLAYLDEGGSRATVPAARHKQIVGRTVDELAALG